MKHDSEKHGWRDLQHFDLKQLAILSNDLFCYDAFVAWPTESLGTVLIDSPVCWYKTGGWPQCESQRRGVREAVVVRFRTKREFS